MRKESSTKAQQCNRAEILYMAIEKKVSPFLFIADSGCTSHMRPRREWFSEFSEFVEPVKIRIGDDSELVATGSGEIRTNVGRLTKVYLVPDLCANLFSISAACDQGIDFKFDNTGLKGYLRGEGVLSG